MFMNALRFAKSVNIFFHKRFPIYGRTIFILLWKAANLPLGQILCYVVYPLDILLQQKFCVIHENNSLCIYKYSFQWMTVFRVDIYMYACIYIYIYIYVYNSLVWIPHLSRQVKMISLKPSSVKSLTTGRFTGGQWRLAAVMSSPSWLSNSTMLFHPTTSRWSLHLKRMYNLCVLLGCLS